MCATTHIIKRILVQHQRHNNNEHTQHQQILLWFKFLPSIGKSPCRLQHSKPTSARSRLSCIPLNCLLLGECGTLLLFHINFLVRMQSLTCIFPNILSFLCLCCSFLPFSGNFIDLANSGFYDDIVSTSSSTYHDFSVVSICCTARISHCFLPRLIST